MEQFFRKVTSVMGGQLGCCRSGDYLQNEIPERLHTFFAECTRNA